MPRPSRGEPTRQCWSGQAILIGRASTQTESLGASADCPGTLKSAPHHAAIRLVCRRLLGPHLGVSAVEQNTERIAWAAAMELDSQYLRHDHKRGCLAAGSAATSIVKSNPAPSSPYRLLPTCNTCLITSWLAWCRIVQRRDTLASHALRGRHMHRVRKGPEQRIPLLRRQAIPKQSRRKRCRRSAIPK